MTRRRVWLRASDCRLVQVTAHTPHGAVLPLAFPAPLDGILAGASRRRRMTIGVVDHHVEPLPLTAVTEGLANQWVWAATCARWDGDATDLRHVHQRWDDAAGERVVARLPAATDVGRWKPWRIPLLAAVAPVLTWLAVGDPDGIARLLDWRVGVGKKRAAGEGEVTRWEVADMGDPDLDRVLRRDDHPARPIPARAAAMLGVDGCDTIPHQIRPPYLRPAQAAVDGGGFGRAPREVIAPWTRMSSPCMAAST